jgi:hypothetical protein
VRSVPEEVHPLTANDLCQVLTAHARRADRSLQIEAGPSEIGQACERRLAHILLGSPRPNVSRDEWTAAVGTAAHAWVEGAFRADNERLMAEGKSPRWLIETPIFIGRGGVQDGHCDLYDLWTHEVIDHKFPGVTAIRKYKRKGHPSRQYEWQAQTYGYGWARRGFPVKRVSVIMYPRSGMLYDAWKWTDDYKPEVAEQAFDRAETLLANLNVAELNGFLPELMHTLPRDTEHCSWCPYFDRTATDPLKGCKGLFYDPAYSEDPPRHEQLIPGLI